ncbi:MAG: RDD family protein [Actinomycetes bacterium]
MSSDDHPDHSDRRPSGLPYPVRPPTERDDLPEVRGAPGSPASWGMRAAARLVDFVLISLPFAYVSSIAGVKEITAGPDKGELTGPLWILLLFPVVYMAYETALVSWSGQTAGKVLCRIKVVDWSTGGLLTPSQAAVRAFVPGVFLLLAAMAPLLGVPLLGYLQFVPLLVYLTVAASPVYRGVHDRAAGSIVLSAPRAPRAGGYDV